MGHDRDDTSVNSPAGKPDQHHLIAPAFEHVAFLVALGFVAGFVDIFGFIWRCLGSFPPTSLET